MNSTSLSRAIAAGSMLAIFACSGKSTGSAAAAGSGAGSTGGAVASATSSPENDTAQAKPFVLSADQLARITVVPVAPTTFSPVVAATGTVAFNADKSTQVLAAISGPIVKVEVDIGAAVHRGEVLATLTSPDFAAAVATYRKADDAYKNLKRIADQDSVMFKADAIARRDLDQALTDASSAASDRDAAIEQMRSLGMDDASISAVLETRTGAPPLAVIRAPIDGVIVEKLVSAGTFVQAGAAGVGGTPCFTIADLSSVWVWTNIFESDVGMVSPGETAMITTAAWPHPIPGHVTYVSAMVDSSTRATSVRVVADNPSDILKRDMFVDVTLTSNRSITGILVPVGAVLRDQENLPFVFVQQPDKGFLRHRVELGYRINDRYQITSGLKSGDRVVSNGALFIQFAESQ